VDNDDHTETKTEKTVLKIQHGRQQITQNASCSTASRMGL